MKNAHKALIVTAATAAIGISSVGLAITHAASSVNSTNPMSNLVQAIAKKFNLNPADVQSVVDAQKTQADTQKQQDAKTRLDDAVTKGTITKAQEDLIIAKQTEQKTFMDSLKSMSETDRQAALKTNAANLTAWATTNNIPKQFIPGGFGRGGIGGHHGMNGTPPVSGTPAS